MSEASLYQALRGHLATLRLAAAAEALPGVLETATAEGLGHTAMLERLLGIEVTATEARRHASLERFASLPASWRLSDFDFDAQPAVDRSLVNELGTMAPSSSKEGSLHQTQYGSPPARAGRRAQGQRARVLGARVAYRCRVASRRSLVYDIRKR